MTVLWLILAFVAGAVFWHKVGLYLVSRTLKRNDALTAEVLEGLPLKSLVKVHEGARAEIEKRKVALASYQDSSQDTRIGPAEVGGEVAPAPDRRRPASAEERVGGADNTGGSPNDV